MDMSDPKTITVWLARAIAYVAYAFLVLTQIILIQGFLLKLFGANPSSDYTQWAYRSLDRVMAPFRGIFESIPINGDAVLDTSILFAMVIYGIVALAIRSLLDWLTYRLAKLERQRQLEEQATMSYSTGYAPAASGTATIPPYPTDPATIAPTEPGQESSP